MNGCGTACCTSYVTNTLFITDVCCPCLSVFVCNREYSFLENAKAAELHESTLELTVCQVTMALRGWDACLAPSCMFVYAAPNADSLPVRGLPARQPPACPPATYMHACMPCTTSSPNPHASDCCFVAAVYARPPPPPPPPTHTHTPHNPHPPTPTHPPTRPTPPHPRDTGGQCRLL